MSFARPSRSSSCPPRPRRPPLAPIRVPAGTTAMQALKDAGVPLKGPDGAVVVRDVASGDLKDLNWAPDADAEVEPVPAASADGRAVIRHSTAHVLAQAVQELFPGTKLGIGPPVENGFYYDFDPERPFTPEDLTALEKKMQEIVRAGQNFARREISDADAKTELAARAVQARADRPQGWRGRHRGRRRRGRRRAADHVRQPRRRAPATSSGPTCAAARTCRAPAPSRRSASPGQRGRLLARQREEPAAAAHLRHRLGEQGRPQGLPRAAGRGRAPRPPPARRRARPLQLPRRDRLRPGRLPPQGRRDQAGDGGLRPRPAHRGGLRLRRHAAHHQARPVRDLGAPAVLRGHHVPGHGAGEQRVLPQGHELPDAQPDLPVARAVLPRAAAAVLRVRLGLPVREVRRRARPHPRARADPGRLAQLRHPGAGARARSGTCWPSCSACCATSVSTTTTWSCPPAATTRRRKFIGSDEEWAVATAVLEDAAKETGLELVPDPGGAAFYGPKISVQARDAIGRTWQMSTIQYDFNQPARFGLEYTSADGGRAAAGDDPLGQVRLDRAVLRRAHRALRRRVPGLAGPGAGGRHPDHRRAGALPDRRRAEAEGARHPGRDRRLRRPDAEEDPHGEQAEDPVRAARRRHRRRGRRGLLPLPRRLAAQRRPGRPRRSSRSPPGSPPGTTSIRPRTPVAGRRSAGPG